MPKKGEFGTVAPKEAMREMTEYKSLGDRDGRDGEYIIVRWDVAEAECVLVTDCASFLCAVTEDVPKWKDGYTSADVLLRDYGMLAISRESEMLDGIECALSKTEQELLSGKCDRRASLLLVRARRELMSLRKRCEQSRIARALLSEKNRMEWDEVEQGYKRVEERGRELQEYITQVRDAYHSFLGLKQNTLMRAFSVVASIFMPLQLVTGWYGMNLIMPEVRSPVTYWVVIGVCVGVVALSLLLFRKKRWL